MLLFLVLWNAVPSPFCAPQLHPTVASCSPSPFLCRAQSPSKLCSSWQVTLSSTRCPCPQVPVLLFNEVDNASLPPFAYQPDLALPGEWEALAARAPELAAAARYVQVGVLSGQGSNAYRFCPARVQLSVYRGGGA